MGILAKISNFHSAPIHSLFCSVVNGYVAGGLPASVSQGTRLTYNCDPGYQLGDVDSVECGPSAVWSRPLPICSPLRCSSPLNVTNGKISYGGDTVGKVAAYKCKKGHFLQGPHNSTCTEMGAWDPPPPLCSAVDCGKPKLLQHGSLAYQATTYKSVVRYSCLPGYVLHGPSSRQCGSSGLWSRAPPRCAPATCSTPPSIPLGQAVGDGPWGPGDKSGYTCRPGHSLVGGDMECDNSGKWKGSPPHCIPLLCPGFGYIDNGSLTIKSWTYEPLSEAAIDHLKMQIEEKRSKSKKFKYDALDEEHEVDEEQVVFYPVGSELEVNCLPGFKLEGSQQTTCIDTDKWSEPFPSCVQLLCSKLSNIDNGQLTMEGFKFQQTARYTCHPGFSLSGDAVRSCLSSGLWSGQEPTCAPRICPEPPQVEGGYLSPLHSVEYGALASYSCQEGFTLVGAAERVCGDEGRWSGQAPICVNSTQSCLVPQLISSGYVSYDSSLDVGSQAWYECSAQHHLVGTHQRSCGEDGWSDSSPFCKPQECSPVWDLPHGTVVGQDFGLGSSLQFSCSRGFSLHGADLIRCMAGQEWSAPPPVCVPLTCPTPSSVSMGQFHGSARRYGDTITYSCKEGHTLLGPRMRRCTSEGRWSGESPYCAAIICPELPQLANGRIDLQLRVPGEKARFHCKLGWELHGSTNSTCTSDGTWSGEMPSCIPAKCAPPSTTSAKSQPILLSRAAVGTKLSWTCPQNLELKGPSNTICLPNGEWNASPPNCSQPICSQVVEVQNGVIFGLKNASQGTEVNFSCDNGYYKVGRSQLSCREGDWVGQPPICSRYRCPTLSEPELTSVTVKSDGDTYAMEYSCQEQYQLEGSSRLVCGSGGKWNGNPPSCKIAFCPLLPDIPKATYQRTQTPLGGSAHISCQPGFKLKGASLLKCKNSGTWDKPFPYCMPLVCPVRRSVRHGTWKRLPGEDTRSLWASGRTVENVHQAVAVGDRLKVICDPGFEVFRKSESECLPSLTLEPGVAKCRASHCPMLPSIQYGSLAQSARYKGATAVYQCQEGYKIKGQNTRKCLRNKIWSGTHPTCVVVTCPQPHEIAHGEIELKDGVTEFGAMLQYSCHLGHELIGQETRKCGKDGQWHGVEPECIQVKMFLSIVDKCPFRCVVQLLRLPVSGMV